MTNLPGLACLNNPNAMQPISKKVPQFIRAKWEKEIAYYSNSNGGAYPAFSRFSKIVREQARIKNDPNVLAGKAANPTQVSALKPRKEKKTLKTETPPTAGKDSTREKKKKIPEKRETKTKHCLYHERDRHDLQESKAFSAKPLEERTKWIRDARPCFRCFMIGRLREQDFSNTKYLSRARLRTVIWPGKCDSRRHYYYEF